jgi:hypothetical protein
MSGRFGRCVGVVRLMVDVMGDSNNLREILL